MTQQEGRKAPAAARDEATGAIEASYRAFPYESRPCPTSTPARIATIARLMGVEAPEPATARVLEIACSNGGNLVPMAAVAPAGRFVGIDLAAEAVDLARAMARDLGLSNVELVAGDLRDLPAGVGTFDYIVAHGFYSWVPAEVRAVLFETLRTRLAPGGIAFVSHNVLPGCALRGLPWSAIRPFVMDIEDPRKRVAEARAFARRMAETMSRLPGMAVPVAGEFLELSERQDIVLVHDDFAPVNHPVYLRDLVEEAGAHGLAWLGDADPYRHVAYAYDPPMNAWLAGVDRMTQEHVVDHLRLRRFRESLFVHRGRPAGSPIAPERLAPMHVAATHWAVERGEAMPPPPPAGDRSSPAVQRRLLDRIVALHPASIPVAEAVRWIVEDAAPGSALADPSQARRLLLSACTTGMLIPLAWPAAIPRTAGERPRAFGSARWQAPRYECVVNLRHDGVTLEDPVLRRLLPLLDGTRTRGELATALGALAAGTRDPAKLLDDYVAYFAKIGLIEA